MYVYIYICQCVERYIWYASCSDAPYHMFQYMYIYTYIYIFILHISYTSLIHTPIIYLFIYILIHLWRFPKIEVPPRSSILDWEFPLETI